MAVRSSSLLEDSQYQPLSGMYATYMLPNNQSKVNERLDDLVTAIKLVYASTFYQDPKSLISRSVHRIEEEKMAVILMEMVGQNYNDRYYPTFSGTAQSFNFYPISYMKRNDGVAHLALGLGRTIANGENAADTGKGITKKNISDFFQVCEFESDENYILGAIIIQS